MDWASMEYLFCHAPHATRIVPSESNSDFGTSEVDTAVAYMRATIRADTVSSIFETAHVVVVPDAAELREALLRLPAGGSMLYCDIAASSRYVSRSQKTDVHLKNIPHT